MGKGFQNFMSKKDFHPSAWWNLKKKWELEQKDEMEKKRQEELRIQYEKEQDVLNNKALLGDEKARLGLSFMYDAPAGINRKKEEGPEPKFEWQRKYNAPREEWAKGNELIQDQPFGIQVRNVRCVKCRTWGHLNTDNCCPLYGMSGNADNPGYSNKPSDVYKQLNSEREILGGDVKPGLNGIKMETKPSYSMSLPKPMALKIEEQSEERIENNLKMGMEERIAEEIEYNGEAPVIINQGELLENMREEHNLRFKTGVLMGVQADEGIRNLTNVIGDNEDDEDVKPSFEEFLKGLSEKKKNKILAKIMYGESSTSSEKKKKGSSKHKHKKSPKHKKSKKHKKEKRRRYDSDSD